MWTVVNLILIIIILVNRIFHNYKDWKKGQQLLCANHKQKRDIKKWRFCHFLANNKCKIKKKVLASSRLYRKQKAVHTNWICCWKIVGAVCVTQTRIGCFHTWNVLWSHKIEANSPVTESSACLRGKSDGKYIVGYKNQGTIFFLFYFDQDLWINTQSYALSLHTCVHL